MYVSLAPKISHLTKTNQKMFNVVAKIVLEQETNDPQILLLLISPSPPSTTLYTKPKLEQKKKNIITLNKHHSHITNSMNTNKQTKPKPKIVRLSAAALIQTPQ